MSFSATNCDILKLFFHKVNRIFQRGEKVPLTSPNAFNIINLEYMDDKIIIEGRKTFFFAPDTTLLPESHLEDFLAHGYEAYIIDDFRFCPLEKKVEIILETFPDAILFFFIDSNVGVNWEQYIARLQSERGGENIMIGVLYLKRQGEAERLALERYYLFDVGIQCGCIAMEFQKAKNFALIDRVMFANQACGRRRNIRAFGDSMSKANFEYERALVNGMVCDISLSHFSFLPDPSKAYPDIPINTVVKDFFLAFKGMHFKVDASLAIKREINGHVLHIFLFEKHNGTPGLDDHLAGQLSQKIYKTVSDKIKMLLREKFDDYARSAKLGK